MLRKLTVKDFAAVPYLEGSQLMQTHGGTLTFACDRPTVLVGANGAGKSALLTAIALRHLAYFTGRSAFDDHYVLGRDSDPWWTNASRWSREWRYLRGLECDTDNAPTLYYRPGHIPGNENDITTAMMCGYSEEAKAFGQLVRDKSSGQANQAVLASMLAALKDQALPAAYGHQNWRFPKTPWDMPPTRHYSDFEYQALALKMTMVPSAGAVPLILMDEPEQSLDALAQVQLWRAIEASDSARMQVIVATHSAYPLLNPQRFHLVEATPGYAREVAALYGR